MEHWWIDQNRLTGRDAERRTCLDALDRAPVATSRVELIGEPGIGKSTLFDVTLDAAGTRGFRVLLARPNRAEAALAYSCLGDLLSGIDPPPTLTPPERRAFDIALGRALAEGTQISARTLGAAVAATIRALADEGRTLVAIDDVQWLDAASADVLSFVLRRLPPQNTMVLVARRPVGLPVLSVDEQIQLAPLTKSASRHLAAEVATAAISNAAMNRIVTASHGNPLFVIELVRNFAGQAGPILPLPVPASLSQIVADRLRELPDASIEALALSALLAAPTIDALTELGALDDLLPAERAGIVEIVGREVVFSHPLLASAAHDAIPGTRRLRLHRRLAEVTTGLQRCIHLAFGTDHRDALVAAELTEAMVGLTDRGALNEAADLAVLALSITPDDDPDRYERLIRCGDVLFRAGRTREALEHLEVARREAPSPNLVARALLALAIIEYSHTDNAENAERLAASALGLTDDPEVLIEAHTVLARVLYTDFGAAADHAATALRLMEETGAQDDLALAAALNASATANFMAGFGLDRPMFERAIALEAGASVSAADSAAGALAALLKYADELDEARSMLESLVDDADEGSLPYVLGHLPQLDLWMGRWDDAERSARRQLDLARAAEQDSQVQIANFNLAVVGAFRGEIDEARKAAQALDDEGRATGSLWTERMGAGLLGFLAMSVGKAAEAVEHLGRYSDLAAQMGLNDPGYFRFQADFFEALVAVGDIDRAVAEIARMEPFVNRLRRPSALAALHRGRALVAAHRGDVETAVTEARAAVAVLEGTPLVYDRARAMLTLGVVLRRFKLRAEARATLVPALEMFEQMGARSLVERVRIELGRLGVRAVTSLDLTETETRVAQLAAEGRTTRQIADTLFISTKTVEANMTRIYRKLGVGNRAELANLLAAVDTP